MIFRKIKKRKLWLLLFVIIILFDILMQYAITRNLSSNRVLKKTEQSEILKELEFFPIPVSLDDESLSFSYVDTWNQSRTYGGDRHHEGTDIMTDLNEPGIYPVVSMSDGVVEKLGWLELGGYRVGIRTDSGLYLYYAHLQSYMPDIKEGQEIKAGECIGFIGDTGYGKEGTTGKFATHLHVGFYLPDKEGSDEALNPYPYLQKLTEKTLSYHYHNYDYNKEDTA
ncbi:Glycyl-glycine endopeptidase ALE-1 precursor [uncultured Roseburia sp.]|nr:Glycyl-glycine endopeptidase ALE-1 precursor [uncultured Roseburia sp.]